MTEPGADPQRFGFVHTGAERGDLRHGGRSLGAFGGVELVGHFAVDGVGWLVVTDCDSPFEETVFLHLLGTELQPLDTCTLGGAYTPGIVEGIETLGPAGFRILFPSSATPQHLLVAPRRAGLLGLRTRWLHLSPG